MGPTDPLPPDEPLAQLVTTGLAKVGIALKQQAWAEAGGRGLFVDAPFGDGELRLDCPDHAAAPAEQAARIWHAFRAPADPRRDP